MLLELVYFKANKLYHRINDTLISDKLIRDIISQASLLISDTLISDKLMRHKDVEKGKHYRKLPIALFINTCCANLKGR